MICLQLFHLVARSHQISKPKGGGTGQEQEAPGHVSSHQLLPSTTTSISPDPTPQNRVGGVTSMRTHCLSDTLCPSQLLYAPPCLPRTPAAVIRAPGTPTTVLFPGPPSPCSPPSHQKTGPLLVPAQEQQGVEIEFCQCC